MAKPVRLRIAAVNDLDAAEAYYVSEAGPTTVLQFMDAVEEALAHISERPLTGSLRHAHMLHLDGLRFWRVRRFPFLVFYFDDRTEIDIWRILHGSRDIRAALHDPGEP